MERDSTQDIRLRIPGSVAEAISLPEDRIAGELLHELALTLYKEGMLSFGKARELAEIDKYDFSKLLGERGIERHYGSEEWEEDLRYVRGEE